MADENFIIDVQAKFTDKMDGVKKAAKDVDNLEKKAKKLSSKKHTVNFEAKDNASKGINKLLSRANAFGRKHFKGTFSLIDKASPGIRKITSAASSFSKRAFRGTLSFVDKASSVITRVNSSLRSFSGKVFRGTLSVVDKATAPLRSIKNALFSIQTLITGVAAAMATKFVIKSPIDYADTIENSQIAFESLLGSVGKADKMMSDVMQFAKDTPFDTQGVVDGVKQMLVYGIESKKVLTYMEKIGNTTAALGTGEQGIDSITRALGQMKSKNKVSAQEMLQLTEAGVKAWDYLAKGAGVSTSKVQEMTEDGLIPADKAIQYIIDGMGEFDGLMDKASNRTVKGLASNIKDALQQSIVLKWGRGLQQGAVEGLKSMKNWLDRIDPLLEKAGTSLEKMGKAASTKLFGVIGGMQSRAETSMNSKAFQEADMGGKIRILWDDVIWKPFSDWWESKGKPKLAAKMEELGTSLGTGISNGLLALLGFDISGNIDEGASIGASFAKGFAEGFDGEAVGDALIEAIKKGFKKGAKGLADMLLPGDQGASASDKLAGVALGYGGIKAIGGVANLATGTKRLLFGAGESTGLVGSFKGLKSMGETAYLKSLYAKDAITGFGGKLAGSKAVAGLGKFASAAAPYALLAGGLTWGGVDAYKATKKSKEWLGKDTVGSKVLSGIGGFFGGTGPSVTDKTATKGDKAKGILKGMGKGALIGAGIGTFFGPVGTAVGGAIGGAVGGIGSAIGGENIAKGLSKAGEGIKKFFTETLPPKWDAFWEGVGNFFTETIPNALSTAGEKISEFFTETIPTKWDEFWKGVGDFFTETVPYALGFAAGKITTFFTETLPTKWGEFWDSVGTFFTETVPTALSNFGEKVSIFFTETLPTKWSEFWDSVGTFFTETIPTALEPVWNTITTFFTETIPNKWSEFWDGVGNFFTETVPNALETVGEKVTTFFTETLPTHWTTFWDGVGNFFTNTIPTAVSNIGSSIETFFTETIPGYVDNLWGGVKSWVSEKWGKLTSSFKEGYEAGGGGKGKGAAKNAAGGFIAHKTLSWLAEEGTPEMVIPLGGQRRSRGISLWKRAGEMLGVTPENNYNGGIVGANIPETPSSSTPSGSSSASSPNITIDIGEIRFNISASGGSTDILQAIKAQKNEIVDVISGALHEALSAQFQNTPLAVQGD